MPDSDGLMKYGVSVRSAYGVLSVDSGFSVQTTLEWVEKSINAKFEGQAAPFCYPDKNIGPM